MRPGGDVVLPVNPVRPADASRKPLYHPRAGAAADCWRRGPVRLDTVPGAEYPEVPDVILAEILVREGWCSLDPQAQGLLNWRWPESTSRYGDIIRLTRGSLALVPCASRQCPRTLQQLLPRARCRLRGLMLTLRDG